MELKVPPITVVSPPVTTAFSSASRTPPPRTLATGFAEYPMPPLVKATSSTAPFRTEATPTAPFPPENSTATGFRLYAELARILTVTSSSAGTRRTETSNVCRFWPLGRVTSWNSFCPPAKVISAFAVTVRVSPPARRTAKTRPVVLFSLASPVTVSSARVGFGSSKRSFPVALPA